MSIKRSGEWDPDFGRVPAVGCCRRGRARAATPSAAAPFARRCHRQPVYKPPFIGCGSSGVGLDEIAEFLNGTVPQPVAVPPEKTVDADGRTCRERRQFKTASTPRSASSSPPPGPACSCPRWSGYFPVNGDGDDLVVWADEQRSGELALPLPMKSEQFFVHRDFFRPIESGEVDYGVHIVTMGLAVSDETARLFAENKYQDYLHASVSR